MFGKLYVVFHAFYKIGKCYMRRVICFVLAILLLSISVQSAYGFFGFHKTCPRCGGIGRDPATLFLTSCPTCGGDGQVGIFMNDENFEDAVSYLGVAAIVVVGVLVLAAKAAQKR
jgi:hypothetical protein